MPRKYIPEVRSIMEPKDIALREQYLEATKLFRTQQATYRAIRDKYHKNMARLSALLEPETDRVYEYIENLTPEYLAVTPRAQVYQDAHTSMTQAKFGRMMHEMGLIRTTRHGQTRWKLPS